MTAQVGFLLFSTSCSCSTLGLGGKETMGSGKPSGRYLHSAGMYILVGVLSRTYKQKTNYTAWIVGLEHHRCSCSLSPASQMRTNGEQLQVKLPSAAFIASISAIIAAGSAIDSS